MGMRWLPMFYILPLKGKAFKFMVKDVLKNFIRQNPALKMPFILYYQLRRKPWSAGYSFYKYSFIKNILENNLQVFQSKSLPVKYGFRLDERAVEYPWFFSRLKDKEKVILDAGSSLNHPEILSLRTFQERNVHLVTLSPESFKKRGERFLYSYQDLRKLSFADSSFDAVVSISTIEHVGMDNAFLYTSDPRQQENAPSAYLQAVKEIRRVLKDEGTFYATIPFGKYKNYGWFQVFDEAMVQNLIKEFSPSQCKEVYFKYKDDQWNYSTAQDCHNGFYFDIYTHKGYAKNFPAASQSVVCLELIK